jgi:hypothetical protein
MLARMEREVGADFESDLVRCGPVLVRIAAFS